MDAAGGRGIAVQVDHLVPDQVRQPDAWRYLTEVQDAGKPADVTGYR